MQPNKDNYPGNQNQPMYPGNMENLPYNNNFDQMGEQSDMYQPMYNQPMNNMNQNDQMDQNTFDMAQMNMMDMNMQSMPMPNQNMMYQNNNQNFRGGYNNNNQNNRPYYKKKFNKPYNNNQRSNRNKNDNIMRNPENSAGRELAISLNPQIKESNPLDFDWEQVKNAKFVVIKSYSEDNIHKSIKYGIWSSTKNGNEKLTKIYDSHHKMGNIQLIFSVNASGQFLGIAVMKSSIDYNKQFESWAQENKWFGQFKVDWLFIKDVPNKEFRHLIIHANEGKPITNSRDCQEVPFEEGLEVLKIFTNQSSTTTIMEDFGQYDIREADMQGRRENSLIKKQNVE